MCVCVCFSLDRVPWYFSVSSFSVVFAARVYLGYINAGLSSGTVGTTAAAAAVGCNMTYRAAGITG